MALLNEINLKGVPHPIVTDDGYYQEMTVGDAEQLVATTFTEDDAPYNFRTAGGAIDIGDRKQVEGLVGGTITWNQLAPEADFSTHNHWWKGNGCDSVTFSNGIATVVTLQDPAPATIYNRLVDCDGIGYVKDHAYLACYEYKLNAQIPSGIVPRATIQTYLPMFTTQGKDVTSNNWETFARVFKATESSGTSSVLTRFRIDMGASYTDSYEYQLRRPQFFDLTQMFGSTIADYIYSLETATAGAGVAWFRKLFPKPYYAYNAGELMSVKALRHITRRFNAWDGVQEQGVYDVSTGLPVANTSNYRNKNFVPVLPNTKYCYSNENAAAGIRLCYYDANKQFITSRSNGNNNPQTFITPENAHYVSFYWSDISKVCINLSWDGERDGEYEEYSEHVYELDPDLELRGIPKLSAGNDLYYDGDEYKADGTVNRRYGIVDLGTLGWVKYSSQSYDNLFYAAMPTMRPTPSAYEVANILCVNYKTTTQSRVGTSGYTNKYISGGAVNAGGARFWLNDEAYTEASAIKSALNGVMAVYELATPTEESADPYNGTQIVDDFGTEEFVDAGVAGSTRDVAIPVGHNSLYQPNLRAKLEMAPESPEDNGYYVVYHHDGINEYVPLIIPQELPNLPSEDGTYILKCTVASGSATLSFESEV